MRFVIDGPTTIHGTISVAGAKNEALKLFAAALLCDAPVTIRRVPAIEDVQRMAEMVTALGAGVESRPGEYTVDASSLHTADLPADIMARVRAGLVCIGPLLHRFGTVTLPLPGGDAIGRRPIDFFIRGFRAFGVDVQEQADRVTFRMRTPTTTRFTFPLVSVTGTEALVLFAARIPGTTVIENAAREPEIIALAEFLNACGARIAGAGTPTMTITGVERLTGGDVTCIPDRIETGTFAALVAACGGSLEIRDCAPAQLCAALAVLEDMGLRVDRDDAAGILRVSRDHELRGVGFQTDGYPGIATDLQSPLTVAMTQARGLALVHETIFEGRLFFVDKLLKMGASAILCDPHRCVIEGPRKLRGTALESPDVRAGIALLIAAACAEGRSTIENIYQIDRGYEKIEERLRIIGVNIQRRNDE